VRQPCWRFELDPVAAGGWTPLFVWDHPDYVWVADAVAVANQRIADPDAAIGPSHFFRDTPIDDAWLEMVWEHAVMPTLKEHFHGRPGRLTALGLAELRSEVNQPDEDTPTS